MVVAGYRVSKIFVTGWLTAIRDRRPLWLNGPGLTRNQAAALQEVAFDSYIEGMVTMRARSGASSSSSTTSWASPTAQNRSAQWARDCEPPNGRIFDMAVCRMPGTGVRAEVRFAVMAELSALKKLNADWDNLTYLMKVGRERADAWLSTKFDRLGKQPTVDIVGKYL
jgi:hypothetical protein